MQQVNLYVPELRPKKEWMTAQALLALAICFCVLMLFSVLFNRHQLSQFESQIASLEHQRLVGEQGLAEIKSKNPEKAAAKLEQKVQSLRSRVHQRIQVSDLIGRQNLGNNVGYSSRFNALARAVPASMSVFQFRFSQGDVFVEIQGESKRSTNIVEVVDALKQTDEFNAAVFGTLSIHEQRHKKGVFRYAYGFDALFESEQNLVELNQ